jgi:hypothetical protein
MLLKWLLSLAITVIGFVAIEFGTQRLLGVPPHDFTRTRMWGIKRRVLRYAHENNSLPLSLDNIPVIAGHSADVVDWWGNSIEYVKGPNDLIILKSRGGLVPFYRRTEGRPVVCRFYAKRKDGVWEDELCNWHSEE